MSRKLAFYQEYMIRQRPKTPRCICSGKIKGFLGIVSPSLYWAVRTGAKGETAIKELEEFECQHLRYMCYKRTLTKEKWKTLYRQYREERRRNEKL